jgi:hypothetical protein
VTAMVLHLSEPNIDSIYIGTAFPFHCVPWLQFLLVFMWKQHLLNIYFQHLAFNYGVRPLVNLSDISALLRHKIQAPAILPDWSHDQPAAGHPHG